MTTQDQVSILTQTNKPASNQPGGGGGGGGEGNGDTMATQLHKYMYIVMCG